ncbi:hypothetical protein ACFX1T_009237 [Malus domestica]
MAEKMKNNVERSDGKGEAEVEESTLEKCGLSLEKLNLGPRKKLLVLSLGGLLCHRVYHDEASKYRHLDVAYGSFICIVEPKIIPNILEAIRELLFKKDKIALNK